MKILICTELFFRKEAKKIILLRKEEYKMIKDHYNTIINVMHPVCCGLDVHKKVIVACLISQKSNGKVEMETREFKTFTSDLYLLRKWLEEENCPVVAMESTGVYWRPVHNVLEDKFEVFLINPKHAKNIPGKKTDVKDSRWLAELLRHGLLKQSFIPKREVRQWRDLTTLRKQLTESIGDYKRRTQKLFETANIKLDSVLSDLFGRTGRNLMQLLASGKKIDKADIENCVKGRARNNIDEFYMALIGFFDDHHQSMLKFLLNIIDNLEKQIEEVDVKIDAVMKEQDILIKKITEVPGIGVKTAQNIISQIGIDLNSFPTVFHFTAWAGLAPGNNESAGKRRSGRSPVRNKPIKTIFVEASWSAIKAKDTYYRAKYYKLKARLGPKKAIVAIAHKIAKAIFYILRYKRNYEELGSNYLNNNNYKFEFEKLERKALSINCKIIPIEKVMGATLSENKLINSIIKDDNSRNNTELSISEKIMV